VRIEARYTLASQQRREDLRGPHSKLANRSRLAGTIQRRARESDRAACDGERDACRPPVDGRHRSRRRSRPRASPTLFLELDDALGDGEFLLGARELLLQLRDARVLVVASTARISSRGGSSSSSVGARVSVRRSQVARRNARAWSRGTSPTDHAAEDHRARRRYLKRTRASRDQPSTPCESDDSGRKMSHVTLAERASKACTGSRRPSSARRPPKRASV
jgi:hypothetical protein